MPNQIDLTSEFQNIQFRTIVADPPWEPSLGANLSPRISKKRPVMNSFLSARL